MDQQDRIESKIDQTLLIQSAHGSSIHEIKLDLAKHIMRTDRLEGIIFSWRYRLTGILAIASASLVAGKHLIELFKSFF